LYNSKCWSMTESLQNNTDRPVVDSTQKTQKSWFPLWLKIILIVLVWWLLVMWWIIVFFSIKAKMNSSSENDEDEW
jgi:cytoskeletal protein RodZ